MITVRLLAAVKEKQLHKTDRPKKYQDIEEHTAIFML